jgi:hypothetical protein
MGTLHKGNGQTENLPDICNKEKNATTYIRGHYIRGTLHKGNGQTENLPLPLFF